MLAPRRALRLLAIGATATVSTVCSAPPAARQGSPDELDRYRVRRGTRIDAETTFVGMRGRYATYRVRLASDAGLVATGRLLSPGRGTVSPPGTAGGVLPGRFPAVLLNDGRELDSRAIDYLPSDFGDIVVLSLDYPAALPYRIELLEILLHGKRLGEVAGQVPALFSLGGAYLASRADVEPARLALVATSFAVPFAVAAAAADERFRNVALIYGAGDMDRVLAANMSLRPRFLRPAAAWLATRPFRALEPERHVARIAPRPLVMVNGIDDPQMPRPAVEALHAAAREPKELVWLRTGHLMPTDTALIRTLVDTALARLPVLRGAVHPRDDTDAAAPEAEATSAAAGRIPAWIKVAYTIFLAVIVPIWIVKNGLANFLWFSDIAMLVAGAALWLESPLLASTMAVGVLLPESYWNVSFFGRLLTRHRIAGLTDYMFEPRKSRLVRGLSLVMHVALPVVLLVLLARLGYDERALLVQTALAWIVLPVTYLVTEPAKNVNWVFGPGNRPQHRIPPLAYLLLLMLAFPAAVYLPTHLLLRAVF